MYRCYHGCGVKISDEFYERLIRLAKHPPICQCMYTLASGSPVPWSLWVKEPAEENQTHGASSSVDRSC